MAGLATNRGPGGLGLSRRLHERPRKKRVVVLGGPLEGTSDVLLVVRAEAPDEIIEQLSADPWTGLGLLSISRGALESPTRLTIPSMTIASRAILKLDVRRWFKD